MVISFVDFHAQPDHDTNHPWSQQYHPDSREDAFMQLDEEDDMPGADLSKLTCPGESLTSSHAYMR